MDQMNRDNWKSRLYWTYWRMKVNRWLELLLFLVAVASLAVMAVGILVGFIRSCYTY